MANSFICLKGEEPKALYDRYSEYESKDRSAEDLDYLLSLDSQGRRPNLIPGDLVETKTGIIGIITQAETDCIPWHGIFKDEISMDETSCLRMPHYSIDFNGGRYQGKGAWWEASEFKHVISLSPLKYEYGIKEK